MICKHAMWIPHDAATNDIIQGPFKGPDWLDVGGLRSLSQREPDCMFIMTSASGMLGSWYSTDMVRRKRGRFVRKERMDVGHEENLNHIGETSYSVRENEWEVSMMYWSSGYPPRSCLWDGATTWLHASWNGSWSEVWLILVSWCRIRCLCFSLSSSASLLGCPSWMFLRCCFNVDLVNHWKWTCTALKYFTRELWMQENITLLMWEFRWDFRSFLCG